MDHSSNKKSSKIFIGGGIFLLIILLIGVYFMGSQSEKTSLANGTNLVTLSKPSFERVLHKGFTFSVHDQSGSVVTTFTYLIESVQLQNEIIIKGERADTVQGRTFLVINLTITNPSTQTIQLNTRDYIRVSVNDQQELLAASIHNDPVSVQPISTEYTRLALPIDTSVKKIILHVGELSGPKTDIPITLSK